MKSMMIIFSSTITAVGIDCESYIIVAIGVALFSTVMRPYGDEPHFLDVEVLKDE